MNKKRIYVEEGTNIYVAGCYSLETLDGKVLYVGSSTECNNAISRHNTGCRSGSYKDSNKRRVAEAFERDDIVFRILHTSEYSDQVRNMSIPEKEKLQEVLSVLEKMYIDLYKDTIANSQTTVKIHSSNSYDKNVNTTEKRRLSNTGVNNPNCQMDELLVSNILYLKNLGLKPRRIIELLLEHDIKVSNTYISRLGVDRWINLDIAGICPDWYTGVAN